MNAPQPAHDDHEDAEDHDNCCAPSSGTARRELVSLTPAAPTAPLPFRARTDRAPAIAAPMAAIPGGTFLMGSEDPMAYPADGESPVREVHVDPFEIDVHTVTNEEFGEFIEATGYTPEADRFGWSFVFAGLLPDEFEPTRGVVEAPWWRQVMGANWSHPEGPQSDVSDRLDHPVVHVSWADAAAYARWAGKQLPTEAQWERAARGGLEGATFPWGNDLEPEGEHRMNVWQGTFPTDNLDGASGGDGYYGTSPAEAFPPNGFGLYNTTGNVWEWTADAFGELPDHTSLPDLADAGADRYALKGGSFLCHHSYCRRYRPAARMGMTPDSTASNVGFRCIVPAEA